jgi:hypothetical protein
LKVKVEDIKVKNDSAEWHKKTKVDVVRECLRNGIYETEDIIERLNEQGLDYGCLMKYVETERANYLRDKKILQKLRGEGNEKRV